MCDGEWGWNEHYCCTTSLFNSLQICIIAIITRDHKGVYDGPFKFACHTKSKQVRGVRLKGKEGHVEL